MIFEKIRERLQEKEDKTYQNFEYFLDEGKDKLAMLCETQVEAYSNAIDIINQVEAEYNNGWIPCSDRLPENAEWVLCYGKNREGEFKYEVSDYIYEINGWMCSRIKEVIAWQPLPQPPKGE